MNASDALQVPRGDLLLRKSRRWALVALISILITMPCIAFIKPLWTWLATLGTGSFMIAAGVWGLILAAGPILFLVGALCALFLRVEAGFAPRSRPRPASDRAAITAALFVSFLPALTALYPPIHALLTGFIGFRGLGQQYPLASDPYGFWQAVAFWFMGAATLAILAGVYWRAKWRSRKAHSAA